MKKITVTKIVIAITFSCFTIISQASEDRVVSPPATSELMQDQVFNQHLAGMNPLFRQWYCDNTGECNEGPFPSTFLEVNVPKPEKCRARSDGTTKEEVIDLFYWNASPHPATVWAQGRIINVGPWSHGRADFYTSFREADRPSLLNRNGAELGLSWKSSYITCEQPEPPRIPRICGPNETPPCF